MVLGNRTVHGTIDWFKIGKGCILPPCLFNLYADYIMPNAWLDEAKGGIKIARRNINSLIYADDITPMAEREEKLRISWWGWKRRVKSWLKTQHSNNKDHGIQSHHFIASRWGNNGNSNRIYFLGLKKSLWMVTRAIKLKDTCSLEEKLWQT